MQTKQWLMKTLILATCMTFFGVADLMAQPPDGRRGGPGGRRGPNLDMMFDRFDSNGDGSITKAEMEAARKEMFGDRDSSQSREERRDEMRNRMLDRLKEDLAASDEEWAILKPRIEKVGELNRVLRQYEGNPGRRVFRGGEDEAAELKALADAVDDDNATADQLKARMEALRKARKKAEADLEAARKSLREVLTVRQEAYCVANGMLD